MIVILKKSKLALAFLIFTISILLYGVYVINVPSAGLSTSGAVGEKTIIIDPGHGGEDPGAVSDYSGMKEKDVNLNIALKLKELLQNEKYNILMTREEDKLEYQEGTRNIVQKRKQDLIRRKKMIDESGADIAVSIHLNKFPQTKYFGAQTFFPPNSSTSQKLATCIQNSLKENVDNNNNRAPLIKKEPIIILKDNKTTTAIVECGFLSNQEEEKKLSEKEYQDKIAAAIKDGICQYYKK